MRVLADAAELRSRLGGVLQSQRVVRPGGHLEVKLNFHLTLNSQHLVAGCQAILLGPDPVAPRQQIGGAILAVVRIHGVQHVPIEVLCVHLRRRKRRIRRYRS